MKLGVRFPSLHDQLVVITEQPQLTCCFKVVESQHEARPLVQAFLSLSPSLSGQWHNLFVKHLGI